MNYALIAFQSVGVYVFMLLLIRLFGKKELAQLSVIDLVFMLLISNAVQNAMVTAVSDSDKSKAIDFYGGLVAALALFIANYGLKWVMFRYKNINRLIQGEPLLLVYKGVIRDVNLAKAKITKDEIHAAIREHGIEDIEQVSLAILELDGNISVLSEDIERKQTFRRRRSKTHIFEN